MSRSEKSRLILATSAIAIATATPAHGQAMAAADSSVSASNPNGIAEIVVTAQKRSENLQKAPVAITALGGDVLVQKGITNLPAAQELVPGARFHQEGNTVQPPIHSADGSRP